MESSSRRPSRAQSIRNALSRTSSHLTFNSINKKRETEFRTLFPTLSPTEQLIDTFSCALNREILLHGRMYLSDRHICFNANILGWVTNLIIPFKEIMTIEKRMTAFVIPNAIQISTLQNKYFFTSFVSREQAYTKISMIWRNAISKEPLPIDELIHSRSAMLKSRGSMAVRERDKLPNEQEKPVSAQEEAEEAEEKGADEEARLEDLCGCLDHYAECLGRFKPESWDFVHRSIFSSERSLFSDVLKEMQCKDVVGDKQWRAVEFGTKVRSMSCKMPLPAILINSDELVGASLSETVVLDEKSEKCSRSVLEVKMELSGIPGGTAVVYLRLCLYRLGSGQGELMMTANVLPPEKSWFKESIRKALLRHTQELVLTIKRELDPKGNKEARPVAGHGHGHEHEQAGMDQSYFDFNAFLRSLKAMLPLVLLILAVLSYHLYRRYSIADVVLEARPPVPEDRVAKVNALHAQFVKLRLSPTKEAAQARRSLKRIAGRVARVGERLNKIYDKLNQDINVVV